MFVQYISLWFTQPFSNVHHASTKHYDDQYIQKFPRKQITFGVKTAEIPLPIPKMQFQKIVKSQSSYLPILLGHFCGRKLCKIRKRWHQSCILTPCLRTHHSIYLLCFYVLQRSNLDQCPLDGMDLTSKVSHCYWNPQSCKDTKIREYFNRFVN